MRAIINISLPKQMLDVVNEGVKNGKFTSKSEFVRKLIRDWEEEKLFQELKNSEAEILKDVRQSRKEFAAGKGKLLKSLKDLR